MDERTPRSARAEDATRLANPVGPETGPPSPPPQAERSAEALRTQLEEAERRIVRLTDELARKDAVAEGATRELAALTASVCHDFRQPLHAIDGFARLLAEAHAERLGAEGARLLTRIRAQAGRMAQLLAGVEALSRLARSERQDVALDLEALAREALEAGVARTTRRRIDARVLSLPRARGDPSMLRQVFAILLDNALKFTGPRETARIEIGSEEKAGEVALYVRDNGVGFDMRYAKQLFGLFQRLHPASEFEGAGVGLALVQRIICRHGGRVWADAVAGEGATFWFTLPGRSDPGAPAPAPAAPGKECA